MDRLVRSQGLRGLAALSILAFVLWLAAPLLLLPFAGFGERAEAIEMEVAMLDRLTRLEGRRASVASLATVANPPFIVAPDAASAMEALRMRLTAAAPAEVLRIESLSPLPQGEKPGAPVEMSVSFQATESGLYAFLADLETHAPFVRVRELAVKSGLDAGGARVIGGNAVVSAVPLLKAGP